MGLELSGLIKQWNNEKGFGFIKGDNAVDVFFHISALRGDRRPQIGEKVFYVQKKDAQGRWIAEHVRHSELTLDNPTIRQRSSINDPRNNLRAESTLFKNFWLKFVLFFVLLILPSIGFLHFFIERTEIWVLGLYVITSVIAFFLYWIDKKKAGNNSRRIPEANLHFFESLGGWIGALLAQQVFRHKTRKLSYQITFWLIVAVHQVFWFDWVVLDSQFLKYCLSWLR